MTEPQVKSIIERILRLHAESDELAAGIREVYGEAKANGYDKTALGAAVRAIRQRDKLGVDQGTVSNWERAAHVPRGPARKLLERLRSEAPDAPAPKQGEAA